MSQIIISEVKTVFKQNLIDIFETAMSQNPTIYGFIKDNLHIGDNNSTKNEKKRFQVKFNIDSEITSTNKITELLVSFQVLDFGTKTDKNDQTYLLYEVLQSIRNLQLGYFAQTAKYMAEQGKISQPYTFAKEPFEFKMSHIKDQFDVNQITKFYKFQIQATKF